MTEAVAAPAAEVKPGAQPQAQPAATPTPAEPAAPAAEPLAERTFSQRELDEIVERRLAKERRKREDVDRRLKVTEELVLRRAELDKKPAAEQPKAQPAGEPVRGDFETYEAFLEARADWRADRKVDNKFKEREEADRTARAQKEEETQREQFKKAMKESAKDIEDFDEVMAGIKATDPVANVSAAAVEAADAPGRVLYYLAINPAEAERIAGLPVGKQAREIVRLEEKLAKPAVKPSNAPDPIKPVGGGKSAPADQMPDPAKEPDKWMAWRKREIAAKKRSGASA